MRMTRRELIAAGAATGVALSSSSTVLAEPKAKPVLKLSSQEWLIPGKDLNEKLDKMEKWGFEGLEVGGGNLASRIDELQKALSGRKVKLSAICAGFQGVPISDQAEERAKFVKSAKEILAAAGALGSTGLIYVPAFNGQTKLDPIEGRKILLDMLPELSEHAVAHKTRLLMEPLNRGETWYIRLLADAASICRDVNHPGCRMMGDFYHMYIEETSDQGAFLSSSGYLHHVHLASIRRKLPHQDERDFRGGFRGLKMIGYQDYCSLECSIEGDAEVELPKTVKFLKQQWIEAKI